MTEAMARRVVTRLARYCDRRPVPHSLVAE
jgi:hypothetical protein